MDYPEMDITKIEPHPDNPRMHSEEQINKIATSIKELGWGRPIIIGIDHHILAGHGAYLAAQQLGMKKVPIKIMPYKHDEPEALAYMVADNRLTDESDWNYGKIELINNELKIQGFNLKLTGFEELEIEQKIQEVPKIHDPNFNPENEWQDMPEFIQEDMEEYQKIIVHFETKEDMESFSELINQKITNKTTYIWHPKKENLSFLDKVYEEE